MPNTNRDKRAWWFVLITTLLIGIALTMMLTWQASIPTSSEEDASLSQPVPSVASDDEQTAAAKSAQPEPLALPPQSGEYLAADLADMYRQADQALVESHMGRRMRVVGRVAEQQEGQDGVLLISLDAGDGVPPQRLVMEGEAVKSAPSIDHYYAFDCLNGGILMGEPLLSDCQVVRR